VSTTVLDLDSILTENKLLHLIPRFSWDMEIIGLRREHIKILQGKLATAASTHTTTPVHTTNQVFAAQTALYAAYSVETKP